MINFNLCLRNPWWQRSGNKFWELQIDRDDVVLLLGMAVRHRVSHAGLSLEIGLLGYCLNFDLYDSRHWDYENNCWEDHRAN